MKRIGWVAALLLLVSSSRALAGDEPEHRVLVYGLAIAAGCSEREARLIANSSWSMDKNHTTEAMHGAFQEDVPAITNVVQALRRDPALAARLMSDDKTLDRFIFDDKGALSRIGPAAFLHALNPKKGETTAAFKEYIQTQVEALKQSGASAEQLRQARLVLMGQYLHMYVDSFVHPDDPLFGHAKEGHPADYAYAHPKEFTQAAMGTVKELRGFLKEDGRHDVDKRLETIGLGSEEKQKEFCAKLVDAVARGYSQDPDKRNVVQRYMGDVSPEEVRHAERNVESTMNGFFKSLGTTYTLTVPKFENITYKDEPGGKFRLHSEGSDPFDLKIDNFVHWAQAPERKGKYDEIAGSVRQKVREDLTWLMEERKNHRAIGTAIDWKCGIKTGPPQTSSKLGEPGGIKFEDRVAEDLAFDIDLRSVRYDPTNGTLLLSGARSDFTVDMELFVTALRLAVERHDPFFSLDPVRPADYDRSLGRVQKEISDRYFQTKEQRAELVARLERLGRPHVTHQGRDYSFVPLSVLAPDVEERVLWPSEGFDPREKLVFSPVWLNGTRVGEILFGADVTIKAIVTGLVERDSDTVVADVWDIEGFEPDWLFDHSRGGAGRVDLELEDSVIRQSGGSLDLSQVRPKLRYVHRHEGTFEDVKESPPCPSCTRVTDHFARHWDEYARRLPILRDLTNVFRSYVAAKVLVRRSPGLVDRILSLPRPPDAFPPQRFHQDDPVLWISVQDGHLAPLTRSGGRNLDFFLGLGAAGGIDLSGGGRIRTEDTQEPSDRWVVDLFSRKAEENDFREQGDQAAVRLHLFGDHLPKAAEIQPWLFFAAGAVLLLGVLFRAGRRQHREGGSPLQCAHCVRVHRVTEAIGFLGDAVSVGTLAYLMWMPFEAARRASSLGAGSLWVAAVAVAGTLAAGMLLSFLVGRLVAHLGGGVGQNHTAARALGSGARWLGLAAASFLLAGGVSTAAVGTRVVRALGPAVGERLLVALDGPDILAVAALVLLVAGLTAIVARWVIPPLRHSRPLLLAKPH